MVNDDGVRFTNEAANYNALGNAFHVVDVPRFTYINHPAWLVLDHHFLSRYGLAGHRPPAPTPDWIIEGPTIARLAQGINVPAPALQATIERWNGNVAAGATRTSAVGTATTTERGAIPPSAEQARARLARSTARPITPYAYAAGRSAPREARGPIRTGG